MTATRIATVRTRAYSNPVGQRRVRATSPGRQTSYAWDHALDAVGNHRAAAAAHGIERHGMTSGARGEDGRYVGAAGSMEWSVTDYSHDEDEVHPDAEPHVPMHTRIARAKRDREDSNWDFVEPADPYGLDEDIPGFLARYAE